MVNEIMEKRDKAKYVLKQRANLKYKTRKRKPTREENYLEERLKQTKVEAEKN